MSAQSDLYQTNPPAEPAPVRAFVIKFKNVWGETAYIVLAPDAWQAISAAERALAAKHDANEYPYRLVFVREMEGAVVRTPGLQILDASEAQE